MGREFGEGLGVIGLRKRVEEGGREGGQMEKEGGSGGVGGPDGGKRGELCFFFFFFFFLVGLGGDAFKIEGWLQGPGNNSEGDWLLEVRCSLRVSFASFT